MRKAGSGNGKQVAMAADHASGLMGLEVDAPVETFQGDPDRGCWPGHRPLSGEPPLWWSSGSNSKTNSS